LEGGCGCRRRPLMGAAQRRLYWRVGNQNSSLLRLTSAFLAILRPSEPGTIPHSRRTRLVKGLQRFEFPAMLQDCAINVRAGVEHRSESPARSKPA
jgi:hypothetical protein